MNNKEKMESQNIPIGSGLVYLMEFSGTIPEDATIETAENLLGATKSGATVEYTTTMTEVSDDLNLISKTITTKEEVKLKLGVFTWNGKTLPHLIATARETEDSTKKRRTVKIGGIQKDNGKSYLLRFVHTDVEDGTVRFTIVGKNTAGLSFAFVPDQSTVLNPEFKAEPNDAEGTLLIYEEDMKSSLGGE